jgi:amino acid adenylation domain-containing protein
VEWLKSHDRDGSLAYWRALLQNYEAGADIPTFAPHPDQPFTLECIDVSIDTATHQSLLALAAARDATVSSVIQAAWGVVLGRYSDTRDVVFGAVVSGRSPDVPEVERVAGLLINTIPVRVTYDETDSFAALVSRVQRQSIDSQPHHASRLAEIQQQTELRSSVIRQLVVFENYPAARVDTATIGATVQVVATSEPTTYDLVLVAEPSPELRLTLQYNAATYSTVQMTRLAAHLGRFLRSATAHPDVPIGQLDMLDEAERESLLHGLNETTREYPSRSTLAEQFAEAVRQHGPRTALCSDGAAITYDELDQRSNRLAHHLAACGVRPGDRVATVLDRSTTMIEAVLAVVKLGASYVPHDPASPPDRLTFAIADADIRTVIALATSDVRVPNVTRISPDADAPIIATRPATAPLRPADVGTDDEAVLFYTSGSTGTPKAVRVPHRAVLRLVLNTDYVTLGTADRVAHMSNVAFDAATFEIWGALLNGAEVHPFGRDTALTPHALGRELRSRGITTLFVTTALFNQIAREAPDAFATLDTLLFGGELVDIQWVKRVLARGKPKRLLHVYGPTETCTFATWHTVASPALNDTATIPIGRPIANTTAYVVDRDMNLQPLGASGELMIGGDGVGLGYHDRPDLTAAAFIPDPFGRAGATLYRTGDIVCRNLAGEIEFLGRRDSQVKLRGFRIELGEVETALRTFANVADALVIAHQDEASGDRRLVAYLVLQSAPERTIELAIRNHLRQRLPGYMIPSVFVILERFPLNANGKVDRKALPPPTRSGMGFGRTFIEPINELEKQLARIWALTLGTPSVGRSDNFFELGGHSLTASTAISHIRAELKVDVPIASFFQSPTLESLAVLVAELQSKAVGGPTRLTRVAREAHQAPEAAKSSSLG